MADRSGSTLVTTASPVNRAQAIDNQAIDNQAIDNQAIDYQAIYNRSHGPIQEIFYRKKYIYFFILL